VAGPDARLIRIVLHGVRGSLRVGEKTYNLEMPGFGPILTDAQIAAILSFVRKQFNRSEGPPNQPPRGPITAAAVSQVRGATRDRNANWTGEELLEIR
jgi:mono/diheme cytochrome c family protein